MIVANAGRDVLSRHLQFAIDLFQRLGWILNLTKSELTPTRCLQFIGGQFDTGLHRLFVPRDRWDKIQPMIQQLLSHPKQPLRFWQQLLGLLTSAQSCTELGRLQLRPLQRFLYRFVQRNEPQTVIHLPDWLTPALQWWTHEAHVLSGVSMRPFCATKHLFTDASMIGWGAHMDGEVVSGQWSVDDQKLHINCLEFRAGIIVIRHWRNRLSSRSRLLGTGGATVVWYINRRSGVRCQVLGELTLEGYLIVLQLVIRVVARLLAGFRKARSITLWRLVPLAFPGRELVPVGSGILRQTVFHTPSLGLITARYIRPLSLGLLPFPD